MVERRGSEVLQPIPLSRLNILVHPLFLADYPLTEDYVKATANMKVQALKRFAPQNPSEFLLVMPHQRSRNKENPKWLELFLSLKNASEYNCF